MLEHVDTSLFFITQKLLTRVVQYLKKNMTGDKRPIVYYMQYHNT